MATLPHIQNYKRRFWQDPSFWTLAVINIYFAVVAYRTGLNNYTLIWLYWWQSVLIGVFNFLRIITLSKFSTKNYKAGKSTDDMAATPATKYFTAFFFLFHYGFFHLVYLIFIYSQAENVDWTFVKNGAEIFLVNSVITFFIQKNWDFTHVPNIGELMFFPYLRIVPIHLTIMFGAFFPGGSLIIFMILKTVIDLIAHVIDIMLREKYYDEDLKVWVNRNS